MCTGPFLKELAQKLPHNWLYLVFGSPKVLIR
jgi:hypothetical protein